MCSAKPAVRRVVRTLIACLVCGLATASWRSTAYAIRPFITDDARVVGARLAQLETWVQGERSAFQHWILPAFGPTEWLELTLGGLHGFHDEELEGRQYSTGGPLMQGKVLLRGATENGAPGLALVLGTLFAGGHGSFQPRRSAPFAYVAATESLFSQERVLVHANVGVGRSDRSENWSPAFTAGLATQIRLVAGLHGAAEVVWNDAYAGEVGGAWQFGARYIFGDRLQMDTTVGQGIGDSLRPPWFTAGLRMVTSALW